MVNCAILNCKNNTIKGGQDQRNVSFHLFPRKTYIKEKWIDATGNKNWFPTVNSRICSIHFDDSCFMDTKKLRRLLPTAIPTIDVLKTSHDEEDSVLNGSKDTHEPIISHEDAPFNTPMEKQLAHKLKLAKERMKLQVKKIKRLRELSRRKSIKINNLMAMIVSLKNNFRSDEQVHYNINITEIVP